MGGVIGLLRVQKLAPSFKDLGNLIFSSFITNIFEEKKKFDCFKKKLEFLLGLHGHKNKHDFFVIYLFLTLDFISIQLIYCDISITMIFIVKI